LAEQSELRRFVAHLPETLSTIILMRYFDGLTAKECAQILAVTVNAVNLRLCRAIKRLRGVLALS
jgi:RNA polymerase sigma factor (sigma-70 family)